jgi:UDP-glucose 4-epimerase
MAHPVMNEYYHGKKVLITGGLGMIGSSIAQRLVRAGADVAIVDACLPPFGANEFNIRGIADRVKVFKADIRDPDALAPIIRGCHVIFNLAAQVSHNDSLEDPRLDAEINYLGHLNVLETARRLDPRIKILFSGSRLQFGRIEKNPVAEDHPQRPLTPYALNKGAAENVYLYYHRRYDMPVVVFRIANPYGPRGQFRHSKYCMVNWFIRQAMNGEALTIYGDGNQVRDYIYIDDLAEVFVRAGADDRCDGQAFNIGSGRGVSFNRMAETVLDTVKSGTIVHVPWPAGYVNVETGDYVSDIGKISRLLGWGPQVGLEEGIARTCAYYKEFASHYR